MSTHETLDQQRLVICEALSNRFAEAGGKKEDSENGEENSCKRKTRKKKELLASN
jgi:hypothetical protein